LKIFPQVSSICVFKVFLRIGEPIVFIQDSIKMPRTHRNSRQLPLRRLYWDFVFWLQQNPEARTEFGFLEEYVSSLRQEVLELQQSYQHFERELEGLRQARGSFLQAVELEQERVELRLRIEAVRELLQQMLSLLPAGSGRRFSF
jgi:hypothetical protein